MHDCVNSSIIELLKNTALQAQLPALGLKITQYQDISIPGVLDLILQSALSMREVIQYPSDFLYVHSPGLVLSMSASNPHPNNAIDIHFAIQLKAQFPQR